MSSYAMNRWRRYGPMTRFNGDFGFLVLIEVGSKRDANY